MIHKSNSSYREILEARARHGKPWTQGLHIVQMATPDLVITDVLLPETDGLEVTTALHRDFPATRMIALSEGMADMNFLHVAVEVGAHRRLRKPLTLSDLRSAIRQECASRQAM
jgi:YesN/AraC family two-component response regulator